MIVIRLVFNTLPRFSYFTNEQKEPFRYSGGSKCWRELLVAQISHSSKTLDCAFLIARLPLPFHCGRKRSHHSCWVLSTGTNRTNGVTEKLKTGIQNKSCGWEWRRMEEDFIQSQQDERQASSSAPVVKRCHLNCPSPRPLRSWGTWMGLSRPNQSSEFL